MFDLFSNLKPCDTWNCINSFALWISAIGMVFISSVSLWLSVKDKLVRIKGEFGTGLIPSDLINNSLTLDRKVYILKYVNIGIRKVKINSIKICVKNIFSSSSYFAINPQLEKSLESLNKQFPILLDEMEDNNLIFDINYFINLNNNPLFHKNKIITWCKINTTYLILVTSIGIEIKIKFNKDAKKYLWEQYIKLKEYNE